MSVNEMYAIAPLQPKGLIAPINQGRYHKES